MHIWQWICDHLFFWTDSARLHAARRTLEAGIMENPQACSWLDHGGWDAAGHDGPAALRNPTTRDAVLFRGIENIYDAKDNPTGILQRFTAEGFNNGTTTHTYLLNLGEGSLGRSSSNHQGVLVVDESARPPIVTISFRGTHPLDDIITHIGAVGDFLSGKPVKSYEDQMESFWQGAQGDITRIMDEVAARHPGQAPQILVAGHSYGGDAAARMVSRLAEHYSQWKDNLSLIGFGATPSFSREEQASIYALLGNNPDRARQYMTENDWMRIPSLGFNGSVGVVREINCPTRHEYAASTGLSAMMDAVEQRMARDPQHAEQYAQALVAAYRRDPNSVLSQLAAYTSSPPAAATVPPPRLGNILQPA